MGSYITLGINKMEIDWGKNIHLLIIPNYFK